MSSRASSLVFLFCLIAMTSSLLVDATRVLEQQEEFSGIGYFGVCFNVKEYDDDGNADDDGNSYFYNGAYRAAYGRYAAFFLCSQQNRDRNKDGPMLDDSNCVGPYVTDLGDFMDVAAQFSVNYCDSCQNECRRRVEEEAEEEEVYVTPNCRTCKNQCSTFWSQNYYYDEADFQCQASYQDGDAEFYSAPQCISGQIVLGSFYDEDCKFKTSQGQSSEESAALQAVFATAETMTFDCNYNENVCQALAGISFQCNDNNANAICKSARQALRTRTYYKKPWTSKFPTGGIIALLLLGSVFCLLSYVYYVRHTQQRKKEPLMDGQHLEEGHKNSPPSSPSKQSSLPPIT